ncbi:MAG: hypothetical protein AAGJ83_14935 [Planctomycetota bacterium]
MSELHVLRHPQFDSEVRFEWKRDRFVHAVSWQNLHVSPQEESGDAAWPSSPPLQQLSLEVIDDKSVALGVGCAGTSHWSLSVEAVESGFRFDWACRTKTDAEFLGIHYLDSAFQIEPDAGSQFQNGQAGVHQVGACIVPSDQPWLAGTHRWGYVIRVG